MNGLANSSFSHFCVVGCGHHARSKLIPAIRANGQYLLGVVSSQPQPDLGATTEFNNLADALSTLPSETVFLLSTPPTLHFEQTMAILHAGRDVIVEKPAFVTTEESERAYELAEANGLVLAEAFMHRHTGLFRRLMAWWDANGMDVRKIETAFLIPKLPTATFRQTADIGCSGLYDIGCYPLSLFADFGLSLDRLVLQRVTAAGDPTRESIEFGGRLNGMDVTASVGIGAVYMNVLSLRTRDGGSWTVSPMFYGRSGRRTLVIASEGRLTREFMDTENAFEEILRVRREEWRSMQPGRRKKAKQVVSALERLGRDLRRLRMLA
jgi:predicted dehydrogenase